MPARQAALLESGPPPEGKAILDAARFSAVNRRRLSAPALRTFLAIADLWGLDEQQRLLILGLPSRSTYYNWVKAVREHRDVTLDVDVLLRISAVFGIHQALGVLHPTEAAAVSWLKTRHDATVFGGQPPLRLITSGTQDGLMSVRRFLDAARGGLYMPPNEADDGFTPYTDTDLIVS
ncbi:MbcA/ParS/Xre antitoxin family protein [Corticibacterium sp. UT-5YL-CI-8]|nr:MbcA/ParS/Xre antitoxin family protein [Tianweitania sp. UT-5YL-CI-8]